MRLILNDIQMFFDATGGREKRYKKIGRLCVKNVADGDTAGKEATNAGSQLSA